MFFEVGLFVCQPHTLAFNAEMDDTEDNDCDSDHSFSQLPVHKALTCPWGQGPWVVALPWLAKEICSMHKVIDQGVPLRSLAA